MFVELAFRGALLPEDEIHKLLTEIRAGTDVVGPDIDLVQVLESEDVAVAKLGNDTAEEKAKFVQACPGALHRRVGERQVNVDTVDAVQAKFPQPNPYHILQVGPRLLDPQESLVDRKSVV